MRVNAEVASRRHVFKVNIYCIPHLCTYHWSEKARPGRRGNGLGKRGISKRLKYGFLVAASYPTVTDIDFFVRFSEKETKTQNY